MRALTLARRAGGTQRERASRARAPPRWSRIPIEGDERTMADSEAIDRQPGDGVAAGRGG